MSDVNIDFQKILGGMCASNNQGDPIKSIYEIIPTYDNVQQHLLFQAHYFIQKYDLEDVERMFTEFADIMAKNKNLGYIGSQNLKNLLAAYTQNEYLRGIKVQTVNDVTANK